jgi:hypothetical protein
MGETEVLVSKMRALGNYRELTLKGELMYSVSNVFFKEASKDLYITLKSILNKCEDMIVHINSDCIIEDCDNVDISYVDFGMKSSSLAIRLVLYSKSNASVIYLIPESDGGFGLIAKDFKECEIYHNYMLDKESANELLFIPSKRENNDSIVLLTHNKQTNKTEFNEVGVEFSHVIDVSELISYGKIYYMKAGELDYDWSCCALNEYLEGAKNKDFAYQLKGFMSMPVPYRSGNYLYDSKNKILAIGNEKSTIYVYKVLGIPKQRHMFRF